MDRRPELLLVLTAYDVAPFLPRTVGALARQTDRRWRAVFVDDASTDGTGDRLETLLAAHGLSDRFAVIRNETRRHKARNVFRALEGRGAPEDIVVIHDGDDWLGDDRALEILRREHERGWEVVWSSWRGSDGRTSNSDHLNPWLPPRLQPWVSSHLFSFRRHLFDAVEPADLQDARGRWIREACDSALAWPVLEQTIKRKHLPKALYVYNRENPRSHDKSGVLLRGRVSRAQARTQARLRAKGRKPLRVDWRFALAHHRELLFSALRNARLVRRYGAMLADAWRFRIFLEGSGDDEAARSV